MKKHNERRALAALLMGLMLLMLLGAAPAVTNGHTVSPSITPDPQEEGEGRVIRVMSVDELIAAIAPRVTVELMPGEYELASAASYGKDTNSLYCRWGTSSEQGFELEISGVDGLTIRGAGREETTLIAEDRYANVLSFSGCRELKVADLTAGHSPAPGYCTGGVLNLTNCTDAAVENCGLFGCGSTGVWATNCSGLIVTDSRIYECSDSAVSADGCRNVQVLDSEIDHNGWKLDYPASCLFRATEGDGFTVSGCRVHDNWADLLLMGSYTRGVAFLSDSVEYNTLKNAFAFYGVPGTVDECAFHWNDVESWYASGYEQDALAALDLQGKTLSEGDLSAMEVRPIQVIGSEEIAYEEPTEVPPGGEIVVTTVDEFLAAIGPDRTIVLDGERFSLADAANYGVTDGWYYRWAECYDGPQLVIYGASDLTIRSKSEDPAATTLTAAPRYADVICFQSCENLRLSGLTLGHSDGPGDCSGAVLDFESCSHVSLFNCRLYGCGTLGVNAYACSDLRLTDCEIYDCSIGGAVLYSVYGAAFVNCRIHDVPSPMLCLYDCDGVLWNGTVLWDAHYDVTAGGMVQPEQLN